jgi:antirestriction protein
MSNLPQIYVGTYRKYNEGSLFGKWLDLTNFSSKDEFYDACKELHEDEEDPEFMFQDWEYIPDFLIGESWLSDEVFEYFEAIEGMDKERAEGLEVYREFIIGDSYQISVSELVEQFEDCYQGYYEGNAEVEFAEEYAAMTGLLEAVSEKIVRYFDYEAYARDLFSDGFVEWDGHVFSN